MGYSTDQDLFDAIGEETVRLLTDDDGSGTVDTAVVGSVRSDAQEIIKAYLRDRYTLPLSATPPLLTQLEVALTAERLYRRRPNDDTPESVEKASDEAMDVLRAISEGRMTLGIDTDGDGDEDGADPYQFRAPKTPTLTHELDEFYYPDGAQTPDH